MEYKFSRGFLACTRIAWMIFAALLFVGLLLGIAELIVLFTSEPFSDTYFELMKNIDTGFGITTYIYWAVLAVWLVMLVVQSKKFALATIFGIAGVIVNIADVVLWRFLFNVSSYNFMITLGEIMFFFYSLLPAIAFFLISRALPKGLARTTACLWAVFRILNFFAALFVNFVTPLIIDLFTNDSSRIIYNSIYRLYAMSANIIAYGLLALFFVFFASTMKRFADPQQDLQ